MKKKVFSLLLMISILLATFCGCDNENLKKPVTNKPGSNTSGDQVKDNETDDTDIKSDDENPEDEEQSNSAKKGGNGTKVIRTTKKTDPEIVRAEFDLSRYDLTDIEQKTKALKDYLGAIYGKYTLAGQTVSRQSTQTELVFLYANTGRLPAVHCFDFCNATYDTHQDDEVSAAVNWGANCNGIVHVMWHMNVPKDFNDLSKGTARWMRDFDESTQFVPENAIVPGTREYENIMEQIDNMAYQLQRLEVENIPVLFRPLHEAGLRDTFWWGKTTQLYKGLWNMIYDRLTNYHKLKNLIWIWNGQDVYFMPDKNQFDIATWDNYSEDPMATEYLDKLESWVPGKMYGISENAFIPPASKLNKNNRILFWNTWYTEHLFSVKQGQYSSGGYSTIEQYKENYNSRYVITLDELPHFNAPNEIELPQSVQTYADTGFMPGAASDWADDGTLKLEWETSYYQDCQVCAGSNGGSGIRFQGYWQKVSECYLPFSVEEAGTYTLEICYYVNASSEKKNALVVNGQVKDDGYSYLNNGQWNVMTTEIELKQGTNYIGYSYRTNPAWGYLDLDYAILKKK